MLVYICDDNRNDISMLQNIINGVANKMQIPITVCTFPDAESLLADLQNVTSDDSPKPDIIFSDIRMEGMDGIDLGKKLSRMVPESFLVLLTAYEEYAIQGYETRAYRYLLKPATEEDIVKIIKDIYKEKYQSQNINLYHGNQEIHLPMKDVRYICSEDKYSVIHTIHDTILERNSLNYFEKIVEGNTFYRVHRKYLVNLRFHKEFKNGMIVLDKNEMIPVSRRKKKDYQAYLCKLLEGDLLR